MEEARQYSAVTPKLISLAFLGIWTFIMGGALAWALRSWRRSRRYRAVKTWIGEIDEANFPLAFRALLASQVLGMAIGVFLVLIGIYFFSSVLLD